jgi:MFS family permease
VVEHRHHGWRAVRRADRGPSRSPAPVAPSLTIFGVASLLSAFAGSLGMLSLLRFLPGSASAADFAGAAALTGDHTSHRPRATMIMATFTGAPVGGFVGGQIVALLLAKFGWPMIFVLGYISPWCWCCTPNRGRTRRRCGRSSFDRH